MRSVSLICVVFLVVACGDDENPYCDGPTRQLYEPESLNADNFPDDYFTVDSATSLTGLMVSMLPGQDVIIDESVQAYTNSYYDLSTVDGFGTTSDIMLRFSGELDLETLPQGGDGSGQPDASLVVVNLDAAPPEFVDFQLRQVFESAHDRSVTLIISPVGPLLPKTRYGVALTRAARDPSGRCVAPSATQQQLLAGTATTPRLQRLQPRVAELVETLKTAGTISGPQDLSAAVVFTTQSTWETSADIAGQIRQETYTYRSLGPCVDHAFFRQCEGEFDAWEFRKNRRSVDDADPQPQQRHTLPVTTYLPVTGTGPFPTVVFGHGLSGSRHQASDLAEHCAPLGYATISVDAVMHGDHPHQPEMAGPLGIMEFFGLHADYDPPLDGLELRDNFRQSTYDKLQLVELIRPGLDIDGDTLPDVDVQELGFIGASLGGLMSAEFLAFTPEVQLAVIIVPGAKVGDIIQHGDMFSVIVEIFRGTATDGQVARFFPMLQTIIDRGDPGVYGRHVVTERLAGFDQQTPQVLIQMVLGDEIVPNVTNLYFAQSLGLPHVGDELLPIPGVDHEPTLPISNNVAADVTGAVFQYDVIYSDDGSELIEATHDDTPANPMAIEQTLHFVISYRDTGVAELIDPYRTLGVKP